MRIKDRFKKLKTKYNNLRKDLKETIKKNKKELEKLKKKNKELEQGESDGINKVKRIIGKIKKTFLRTKNFSYIFFKFLVFLFPILLGLIIILLGMIVLFLLYLIILFLLYSVLFIPLMSVKVNTDYGILNYSYNEGISTEYNGRKNGKIIHKMSDYFIKLIDEEAKESDGLTKQLVLNTLRFLAKKNSSTENFTKQLNYNIYTIWQLEGVGFKYIEPFNSFCYNLTEYNDKYLKNSNKIENIDLKKQELLKDIEGFLNSDYNFTKIMDDPEVGKENNLKENVIKYFSNDGTKSNNVSHLLFNLISNKSKLEYFIRKMGDSHVLKKNLPIVLKEEEGKMYITLDFSKGKSQINNFTEHYCKNIENRKYFILQNFYNTNNFFFTEKGMNGLKKTLFPFYIKYHNSFSSIKYDYFNFKNIKDELIRFLDYKGLSKDIMGINHSDTKADLSKGYFFIKYIYFNNISLNSEDKLESFAGDLINDGYSLSNKRSNKLLLESKDTTYREYTKLIQKIKNLSMVDYINQIVNELNKKLILKGYVSGKYFVMDYSPLENIYKTDENYGFVSINNPFPLYSIDFKVEDSKIKDSNFFKYLNGNVINFDSKKMLGNGRFSYLPINITKYLRDPQNGFDYDGKEDIIVKFAFIPEIARNEVKESEYDFMDGIMNYGIDFRTQKIEDLNPYYLKNIDVKFYEGKSYKKVLLYGKYYDEIKQALDGYLEDAKTIYEGYNQKDFFKDGYTNEPKKISFCLLEPINIKKREGVINENLYSLLEEKEFNFKVPLTYTTDRYYNLCLEIDNVFVNDGLYKTLKNGRNSFSSTFFEAGRTNIAFTNIILKPYLSDGYNGVKTTFSQKKKIYNYTLFDYISEYKGKSIIYDNMNTCTFEMKYSIDNTKFSYGNKKLLEKKDFNKSLENGNGILNNNFSSNNSSSNSSNNNSSDNSSDSSSDSSSDNSSDNSNNQSNNNSGNNQFNNNSGNNNQSNNSLLNPITLVTGNNNITNNNLITNSSGQSIFNNDGSKDYLNDILNPNDTISNPFSYMDNIIKTTTTSLSKSSLEKKLAFYSDVIPPLKQKLKEFDPQFYFKNEFKNPTKILYQCYDINDKRVFNFDNEAEIKINGKIQKRRVPLYDSFLIPNNSYILGLYGMERNKNNKYSGYKKEINGVYYSTINITHKKLIEIFKGSYHLTGIRLSVKNKPYYSPFFLKDNGPYLNNFFGEKYINFVYEYHKIYNDYNLNNNIDSYFSYLKKILGKKNVIGYDKNNILFIEGTKSLQKLKEEYKIYFDFFRSKKEVGDKSKSMEYIKKQSDSLKNMFSHSGQKIDLSDFFKTDLKNFVDNQNLNKVFKYGYNLKPVRYPYLMDKDNININFLNSNNTVYHNTINGMKQFSMVLDQNIPQKRVSSNIIDRFQIYYPIYYRNLWYKYSYKNFVKNINYLGDIYYNGKLPTKCKDCNPFYYDGNKVPYSVLSKNFNYRRRGDLEYFPFNPDFMNIENNEYEFGDENYTYIYKINSLTLEELVKAGNLIMEYSGKKADYDFGECTEKELKKIAVFEGHDVMSYLEKILNWDQRTSLCKKLRYFEIYIDIVEKMYKISQEDKNGPFWFSSMVDKDKMTSSMLDYEQLNQKKNFLRGINMNLFTEDEKIRDIKDDYGLYVNPIVSIFKKIPEYGIGERYNEKSKKNKQKIYKEFGKLEDIFKSFMMVSNLKSNIFNYEDNEKLSKILNNNYDVNKENNIFNTLGKDIETTLGDGNINKITLNNSYYEFGKSYMSVLNEFYKNISQIANRNQKNGAKLSEKDKFKKLRGDFDICNDEGVLSSIGLIKGNPYIKGKNSLENLTNGKINKKICEKITNSLQKLYNQKILSFGNKELFNNKELFEVNNDKKPIKSFKISENINSLVSEFIRRNKKYSKDENKLKDINQVEKGLKLSSKIKGMVKDSIIIQNSLDNILKKYSYLSEKEYGLKGVNLESKIKKIATTIFSQIQFINGDGRFINNYFYGFTRTLLGLKDYDLSNFILNYGKNYNNTTKDYKEDINKGLKKLWEEYHNGKNTSYLTDIYGKDTLIKNYLKNYENSLYRYLVMLDMTYESYNNRIFIKKSSISYQLSKLNKEFKKYKHTNLFIFYKNEFFNTIEMDEIKLSKLLNLKELKYININDKEKDKQLKYMTFLILLDFFNSLDDEHKYKKDMIFDIFGLNGLTKDEYHSIKYINRGIINTLLMNKNYKKLKLDTVKNEGLEKKYLKVDYYKILGEHKNINYLMLYLIGKSVGINQKSEYKIDNIDLVNEYKNNFSLIEQSFIKKLFLMDKMFFYYLNNSSTNNGNLHLNVVMNKYVTFWSALKSWDLSGIINYFMSGEDDKELMNNAILTMLNDYMYLYYSQLSNFEDHLNNKISSIMGEYFNINNYLKKQYLDNQSFKIFKNDIDLSDVTEETIAKSYEISENIQVNNLGIINEILNNRKIIRGHMLGNWGNIYDLKTDNKLSVIAFNYFSYTNNRDKLEEIKKVTQMMNEQSFNESINYGPVEFAIFKEMIELIDCEKQSICHTIKSDILSLKSWKELDKYMLKLKKEMETNSTIDKKRKEYLVELIKQISSLIEEYKGKEIVEEFYLWEKFPEICKDYEDCLDVAKRMVGKKEGLRGQCVRGAQVFGMYFNKGLDCWYGGDANELPGSFSKGPRTCKNMKKKYLGINKAGLKFTQTTTPTPNSLGIRKSGTWGHIVYVLGVDEEHKKILVLETNKYGTTGFIKTNKGKHNFRVWKSWISFRGKKAMDIYVLLEKPYN